MIKGIALGFMLAIVLGLLGGYLFVTRGCFPANADARPPALERWAAHQSLRASINREAPKDPNPVALTDANLRAGIKLYAANCLVCHGAADAKASNIAQGLYQKAPQLAEDGVEDDPEGKIFWKIKHGIRLTGMPSFTKNLSDQQLWQMTLFLKHMDTLPPAVEKVWKSIPTAGIQ